MFIQNFNEIGDIEMIAIDLNTDIESIIGSVECYGIVGTINNNYTYSIKPQYLRQTYVKRIVEDESGNILKDEAVLIDNFDEIDGEGKILSYKRDTGENWNFDRNGFVYDNGNKVINIVNEWIYKCNNCGWVGLESELIGGNCPSCSSDEVEKNIEQEKFRISSIPICKIPYVN